MFISREYPALLGTRIVARNRKQERGGGTRATVALERAGVPFQLHAYDLGHAPPGGSVGEAVAAQLGLSPSVVFKTLLAEVDGAPVCAIVPTAGTLSLKRLAAAAEGKRARMMDPADAERLSGYVTGGISPFGQLRPLPTFVDRSATRLEALLVSAGQRGLQLELGPEVLVEVAGASPVDGLGVAK